MVMEPSKFDRARMDIQAAESQYEAEASSVNLKRTFDAGQPPPSPDKLLLALSKAMVMVINELDDLSKGR